MSEPLPPKCQFVADGGTCRRKPAYRVYFKHSYVGAICNKCAEKIEAFSNARDYGLVAVKKVAAKGVAI